VSNFYQDIFTMATINWLHLTDLHMGMNEQSYLLPRFRQTLFDDLENLSQKSGPWDFVLFTGDLTQRGSTEEFEKFNEFWQKLQTHLAKLGSKPTFLAIPGNHDLVRPTDEAGIRSILTSWEQREIQEAFWNSEAAILRQYVKQAFEPYENWWKEQQPDHLKYGLLPGDFLYSFERDNIKIGIIGLNTAFLQLTRDNYEGKLALHPRQFYQACEDNPDWATQHHVSLLLTHHPPNWLNQEARQALNTDILMDHFIHLCGHLHETASYGISEGGQERRHIWQTRSLFGLEYFGNKEERSHGYSIGRIEINLDKKTNKPNGKIQHWPRQATQQGSKRVLMPDYSVKLTNKQCTPVTRFRPFQAANHTQGQEDQENKEEEPHDDLSNNNSELHVFINLSEIKNRGVAQEIGTYLLKQGIGYTLPPKFNNNEARSETIRQDLEASLLDCDAVILIYCQNTTPLWVREQLRFCRRTNSLRDKQLKIIAIFDRPPTEELGMQLPNMQIFNCSEIQLAPCLPKFIEILTNDQCLSR
jgi:predicted MPP superfamily phosphohydrolase